MKHQLLLGLALFSLSGSLMAAESLCQQKEQDIQHEIAMAKQHNNQRRVNGLERALTEVRANCSDNKLKASHQARIKAQREKVAERERELKEERQDTVSCLHQGCPKEEPHIVSQTVASVEKAFHCHEGKCCSDTAG